MIRAVVQGRGKGRGLAGLECRNSGMQEFRNAGCMYVGMYVCMFVCLYVCLYVCMLVWLYVCMLVMFVCLYAVWKGAERRALDARQWPAD